jgi:purine-nucleoside phosphorylase
MVVGQQQVSVNRIFCNFVGLEQKKKETISIDDRDFGQSNTFLFVKELLEQREKKKILYVTNPNGLTKPTVFELFSP